MQQYTLPNKTKYDERKPHAVYSRSKLHIMFQVMTVNCLNDILMLKLQFIIHFYWPTPNLINVINLILLSIQRLHHSIFKHFQQHSKRSCLQWRHAQFFTVNKCLIVCHQLYLCGLPSPLDQESILCNLRLEGLTWLRVYHQNPLHHHIYGTRHLECQFRKQCLS